MIAFSISTGWVPSRICSLACSYSRFNWTGSLKYIQYNTAHTADSAGLGPYNIYNTILLIQQVQLDWVPIIYTIQYCSYSRFSWTGSLQYIQYNTAHTVDTAGLGPYSLQYIQYNTVHTTDSAGLGPYNTYNTYKIRFILSTGLPIKNMNEKTT